jgi:ribosomal protein S18 acetylase RimI-like enzyme
MPKNSVSGILKADDADSIKEYIVTWTSLEEMMKAWPLVQAMYPDLTREGYENILQEAIRVNYRQIAFLKNDRCVGLVGLWVFPRVWVGVQAEIDNFIVDPSCQSQGIGKRLLEKCEETAKAMGALILALDTKSENTGSHKFYYREGFVIRGYRFIKPLHGQSVW